MMQEQEKLAMVRRLLKRFDGIWSLSPEEIKYLWLDANEYFSSLSKEVLERDEKEICGHLRRSNFYAKVYFYSVLLELTGDNRYSDLILESALEDEVSEENQLYVLRQISHIFFVKPQLATERSPVVFRKLYDHVYEYYMRQIKLPEQIIPMEERNKNFIVVFTGQMLQIEHGPTKTALDRCRVLMKAMGKEVLLINVAEVASEKGKCPLYKSVCGNYLPEFNELEHWEYEGCRIPFFQCDLGMPDVDGIQNIVNLLCENKPYAIVSIGSLNITADICARVVPVLSISLCPSDLADTHTQFQQIGRPLMDRDRHLLEIWGESEEHVITGIFSSWIKPQVSVLTHAELGLPKYKMILVVVGGRLHKEVDEQFIHMMKQISGEKVHWAFAGVFLGYDKLCAKEIYLKEHSTFVGMQADILALYDCCDLYVNPTRMGGGTSSVEAMSKGIPVVTVGFGDVAVNAGEAFCVESYEQMVQAIKQYMEDAKFYRRQSEQASIRAEKLLDSETAFVDVMEEFERRMRNKEERS